MYLSCWNEVYDGSGSGSWNSANRLLVLNMCQTPMQSHVAENETET